MSARAVRRDEALLFLHDWLGYEVRLDVSVALAQSPTEVVTVVGTLEHEGRNLPKFWPKNPRARDGLREELIGFYRVGAALLDLGAEDLPASFLARADTRQLVIVLGDDERVTLTVTRRPDDVGPD